MASTEISSTGRRKFARIFTKGCSHIHTHAGLYLSHSRLQTVGLRVAEELFIKPVEGDERGDTFYDGTAHKFWLGPGISFDCPF